MYIVDLEYTYYFTQLTKRYIQYCLHLHTVNSEYILHWSTFSWLTKSTIALGSDYRIICYHSTVDYPEFQLPFKNWERFA